MSANAVDMEEPSLLAEVPRPFEGDNGMTLVGSSYSFLGSRKRVRPELVVGADGSNVNLYSVSVDRDMIVSVVTYQKVGQKVKTPRHLRYSPSVPTSFRSMRRHVQADKSSSWPDVHLCCT